MGIGRPGSGFWWEGRLIERGVEQDMAARVGFMCGFVAFWFAMIERSGGSCGEVWMRGGCWGVYMWCCFLQHVFVKSLHDFSQISIPERSVGLLPGNRCRARTYSSNSSIVQNVLSQEMMAAARDPDWRFGC